MTCFEKCTFNQVVEQLQTNYPHRNIQIVGNMIYVDDEAKFNMAGYNLLYCLQQLVRCLEDELI